MLNAAEGLANSILALVVVEVCAQQLVLWGWVAHVPRLVRGCCNVCKCTPEADTTRQRA